MAKSATSSRVVVNMRCFPKERRQEGSWRFPMPVTRCDSATTAGKYPAPGHGVSGRTVACVIVYPHSWLVFIGQESGRAPMKSSVYTPAMSQPRPDFLNLSVAERIQLAEDIWDSIPADDPESVTLTLAQLHEIQTRLQAHDQDPATALPWEQVRSELFLRDQ